MHGRDAEHNLLFDKSEEHRTQRLQDTDRRAILDWILQTGYECVNGINVTRDKV
jgi:hypothetical protein